MPSCKVCKQKFTPFRMGQKTCTETDCLVTWGRHMVEVRAAEAMKEKERKIRERKQEIKSRSERAREAQAAFNAWVRYRDKDEPCISCQRHHTGQYHAGHYRSRGSNPALAYEPLNCHKQCSACNNWKSGNVVEYRINLLKKIGQEKLDWLEGHHEPKKYSIIELKEIRDLYRRKLKELKT